MVAADVAVDPGWQVHEKYYQAPLGSIAVYVKRVKLNITRPPKPNYARGAMDPLWSPE